MNSEFDPTNHPEFYDYRGKLILTPELADSAVSELFWDGFLAKDKLKEMREVASLSQEQLAASVGIHKLSISRYERGIRPLSAPFILAIARPLDLTDLHVLGLIGLSRCLPEQ